MFGSPTTIDHHSQNRRRLPLVGLLAYLLSLGCADAAASERAAFQRLELWSVAAARTEPLAQGMIVVGDEGRRGVGVLAGSPCAAELAVERHDVLHLSFGRLNGEAGDGAMLVVELRPEGLEAELHEFPTPAQGWAPATLDLSPFAGRTVRVMFSVQVPGDAILGLALGDVHVTRSGSQPPTHVLLITSDTHRGDHLAAAPRAADVSTPFLDSLAASGVLFERCLSTANHTTPSHAALLTGQTPPETGVYANADVLEQRAWTLSEAFAREGYATWAVVSAGHLTEQAAGVGQGFDRLAAPGEVRSGAETLDVLEGWLPELAGRPVFLWVHLFDAHSPYEPPREYGQLYADELEESQTIDDDSQRRLARERVGYRGEVSYVDALSERLLSMDSFGDGVVCFTADHGENLGDLHGFDMHHLGLYPSTLHVPLLLRWPAAPDGSRVTGTVSHRDIARTLLDLAGLERAPFPGTSLLRHLDGEPNTPHFAVHSDAEAASITRGRYHLILHLADRVGAEGKPSWSRHATELYDLALDPDCIDDIAASELARARGLRDELIGWLRGGRTPGEASAPVDAELGGLLVELGYAEASEASMTSLWLNDDCEWCQRFGSE